MNVQIPKVKEKIKVIEKDCTEIQRDLNTLDLVADLLPQYFEQFEKLKDVSFENGTNEEREKNNKILRSFLKIHEEIQFQIQTHGEKNQVSQAILAVLMSKKKSFDSLVDVFYKK